MNRLITARGKPAFTILIPTLCEGTVPAWWDEHGFPVTYKTEREAQIEIATMVIEQLQQFLVRERDFEDAISCDDYVAPADVYPDRTITLKNGQTFGRRQP